MFTNACYIGNAMDKQVTPYDRLSQTLGDKSLSAAALGRALGMVDGSSITRAIANGKGMERHWPEIARILGVDLDWLIYGLGVPVASKSVSHGNADASALPSLPVDGHVSAGNGGIDTLADLSGKLVFSPHWRAVKVTGDSAYPVIFTGQYAMVDESRGVTMEKFTEQNGWDLDDDVVLVRLTGGRALLKRFCYHPPGEFVLASVNSGRGSPLVRRSDIIQIIPVVGVVYMDPGEARGDRWIAKRKARLGV